MRRLLVLAGALVVVAPAWGKLSVMAAYWSANAKPSETVAATYPAGVLPGVINKLILTHVPFQDFAKLEASPAWKANLVEYRLLRRRGVEIWVMITNGERPFIEAKAAPGYIRELVDFCVRNDIDGVDIDFEGPESLDHPNYNRFCRDLADALHAVKKRTSMAVHAHWTFPKVEEATMAKMDFILPMAYDQYGNWNVKQPGPHSTFDYAVSSVAKVKARGVPPSKILLGMPTYGYRWWTEKGERKAVEFGWPQVLKSYPESRDKDVVGPGADSPAGVWHYNGLPTVRKKIAWAKSQHLAGIGVWHGAYEAKDSKDSFWLTVRDANR